MEKMMFVLELVGVAAFAISGAMAAVEKRADAFGVMLLGIITALGGGITRDLLLGNTPPVMFTSFTYVLVAAAAALTVFIDACVQREKYRKNMDRIDSVNNVFDAVGLAVFTVSGMNMAIAQTGMGNPFLVIVLGVVTGVGGGLLRDMMLGVMAKLLRKRIYALASLGGGVVYYVMLLAGAGEVLSVFIGMLVIFALRVLATVYKWNLPAAKIEE